MSNEIQISNISRPLVPDQSMINSIAFMAKQASNSKFYSSMGGEAGIMSIMLLARELDIPPMQALSGGIWNIQGKVEMSARMMNMKIRQSGHFMEVKKWDLIGCEILGKRKDTGEILTVTFSLEDAKRANLMKNPTWEKYPREMLFNRCLSILARMLFPDVIGNCYIEDEVKDGLRKTDDDKEPKKKPEVSNVEKLETAEIEVFIPKSESPKIQDEEISAKEAMDLIEAIGNNKERLDKLCIHYGVKDVIDLSREQFNHALKIATSK